MAPSVLAPLAAPLGAVALAAIDPTAIGQGILALVVVAGYVAQRLGSKKRQSETQDKIQEVHVLVNSQMTAALQRINELEKALNLQRGQNIELEKKAEPSPKYRDRKETT